MPTDAEVRDALRDAHDPELFASLADLGLVVDAAAEGGRARVVLLAPIDDEAYRAALRDRVVETLAPALGIVPEAVEVELREPTEADLTRIASVLKGEKPNPLRIIDASAPAPARTPRRNPFTDARTRVLAIASGKGGVGKSSVSTNLSIALAQRGRAVAAVDADVWGFSMPRMLGVERPPNLIDDVIVPPSAHGVRLISMGFFAREDQAVVWRGPMLHKALEQFLTDVHWGEPDYLVVDMPPGTGDVSISIAQFLPRAEVVIVTTPQPAAQKVAQRAAAMAEKVELPVIGVVENMSWFRGDDGKAYEIFGAGGGAELADTLGVPLLGRIPLVPALREGGDAGRPIVVADPDNEAAEAFRHVAMRIDTDVRADPADHAGHAHG